MRAALFLACCAACSLGGSRPNYQYYVLTSRAAPAPTGGIAGARTLVIDQVTIPGYLDREQIASRIAGQHLAYSTVDRWAEPLDKAFERTLTEDLAPLLVPSGIEVRSHGGHPSYDLSVDVVRFERTGPDHVELAARWVLRSDTDVIDSGETRLQVSTTRTDADASTAALSEAVARMAGEVATRVRQTDEVAAKEHRHRGAHRARDG
jgi:uncharacterized lipoprotein YmbA